MKMIGNPFLGGMSGMEALQREQERIYREQMNSKLFNHLTQQMQMQQQPIPVPVAPSPVSEDRRLLVLLAED
jgi:hypothetical protein